MQHEAQSQQTCTTCRYQQQLWLLQLKGAHVHLQQTLSALGVHAVITMATVLWPLTTQEGKVTLSSSSHSYWLNTTEYLQVQDRAASSSKYQCLLARLNGSVMPCSMKGAEMLALFQPLIPFSEEDQSILVEMLAGLSACFKLV